MVFLAMQERELDLRLQHSEEMLQELTEARRENRLLQQKLRAAQSSSGGENALVSSLPLIVWSIVEIPMCYLCLT
jgi:hypothetical protein